MLRETCSHALEFSLHGIFSFIGNLSLLFLKRILDTSTGLCCNNEVEPVFRWLLLIAGNDLHLVTASEFVTDGNEFVIHLCTNGLYTDCTVNGESKIECG